MACAYILGLQVLNLGVDAHAVAERCHLCKFLWILMYSTPNNLFELLRSI